MKKAYQLDQEGYFVGMVDRQKSPLEENVWWVPAGAVAEEDVLALPEIPSTHKAKLVAGQWELIEIPVVVTPEPEAIPELPVTEADQQEELASEIVATVAQQKKKKATK